MTLYITEKGSQVQVLRKALKANGLEGDIVSLAGHILQNYDFKNYGITGSWLQNAHEKKLPFFPGSYKKKISPKKGSTDYKAIWQDVKEAIDEADKIILATDPDNEGVTLGMEVIEKAGALGKVEGMINMSQLDDRSMEKAVRSIDKLPYKNMFAAGDSRSIFDWSFGLNLTRLATVYLGDGKLLNLGGVKTPVVRMVVERDREFENHEKVPYWEVFARVKTEDGSVFETKYEDKEHGSRIQTDIAAEDLAAALEDQKGKIADYSRKLKKTAPPKPHSLADLQKEAAKKYKMSAAQTLDAAQSLYLDFKMQSYPRTDSNFYAEGEFENAPLILQELQDQTDLAGYVKLVENIETPMKRPIFKDSSDGAHTALSPTASLSNYSKIDDNMLKIFDLVARRYIAQFVDDYEFEEKKGEINCGDYSLHFKENVGKKLGWKSVYNEELSSDSKIGDLATGQSVEIIDVSIRKKHTKPRPRFTEASLISAMENISNFYDDKEIKTQLKKDGIGTAATRAKILEDLQTAKKGDEPWLKSEKGKLISTEKARFVIDTLPDDLTSPKLRADMEAKLKEIIKGDLQKEDYIAMIHGQIEQFAISIMRKGQLPPLPKQAEETGINCPLCGEPVVEADKLFKCSDNRFEGGKQKGCKFAIFKDSKPLGKSITVDILENLLAGEVIKGEKGEVSFDKDNKFFLNVDWKDSPADSKELIETPKTFRKGDKFVFKSVFGKTLTKNQAENLLNGKEVKLTGRSKKGKSFKVIAKADGSGPVEKVRFA